MPYNNKFSEQFQFLVKLRPRSVVSRCQATMQWPWRQAEDRHVGRVVHVDWLRAVDSSRHQRHRHLHRRRRNFRHGAVNYLALRVEKQTSGKSQITQHRRGIYITWAKCVSGVAAYPLNVVSPLFHFWEKFRRRVVLCSSQLHALRVYRHTDQACVVTCVSYFLAQVSCT